VLNRAIDCDKQAGKAIRALCEIRREMQNFCDAYEELVDFHAEHFVPNKEDEVLTRSGKVSLADARRYLQDLGPHLIQARELIVQMVASF
jgi:hypothetical protein